MRILHFLVGSFAFFALMAGTSFAQVIDIETFGSGPYPGAQLPAGQTTYIYNPVAQPADFPNILEDGEYVIATNTQQGFSNWGNIGDNTTGSGYMMLVNADENQTGEFYRRQVSLPANTTYDFFSYLVNANSQTDFDFCTANEGGLVLANVTLEIQDNLGAVLASFDTGDIPFNPVPQWEQYGLTFSTPATTSSVNVVLINNSIGGCGNDLGIDDITFRVAVTMEASDDSLTITDTDTDQTAVLFAGANDTLDGNPLPGTENYSVTPLTSLPTGFTLDPSTGQIDVAAGTPEGTYSFDYEVCETTNMFNCDTATVTIVVAFPPLPITAEDDSGSVIDSSTDFTPVLNILNNDTIDGESPPSDFDISISSGSSLPSGLTFDDSTGAVGVVQNTPSGTYSFDYDLCEAGDPTNCETATVTIDVTNLGSSAAFCPAGSGIVLGQFFAVSATNGNTPANSVGEPGTEGSASTDANSNTSFFPTITLDLTGDPDISIPEGEVLELALSSANNNSARAEIFVSLDDVTYTSLGTTGNGGSAYQAFTGNVLRYDEFTVPPGGIRYVQIDHQTGGIRSDGVIYGNQCHPVTRPPLPITVENDTGTVADSSLGFTSVLNVLDNDTIDGEGPPSAFDLSISPQSSLPTGLTFNENTGAVGVLPNTPTGIYNFDYLLCEVDTPTNCEIATVTINVTNPGGGFFCPSGSSAVTDTFFAFSAVGGNTPANSVGQPNAENSNATGGNSNQTFFPTITMDLTGNAEISVPEGETLQIALSSVNNNNARAEIFISLDGVSYTSLGTTGNGGSVYGAFTTNTLRYDDFIVPAGGARFVQVDHQNAGVLSQGVIYNNQCQPAAPTVTAVDDEETVQSSAAAQSDILNVVDNDSFDGQTPTTFDLAINTNSNLPPELTFNSSTGEVGAVAGAPDGTYSFDYDICEAGTTNCDTATATIIVGSTSASTSLMASKTFEIYDPNNEGLYLLPGNDVVYTISVENTGTQSIDENSMVLIDILPSELSFYNADLDDAAGPATDPVLFTDNGSGLTFTYATDVGFSQSTTPPPTFADCDYDPILTTYDPSIRFICFNPKGEMAANSDWAVSFRMQIK